MNPPPGDPGADDPTVDQKYIRMVALATGYIGGAAFLILGAVTDNTIEGFVLGILLLVWSALGTVLSLLIRLQIDRARKLESQGISAAGQLKRANHLDDIRFTIIENIFTPLYEPARRRDDIRQIWRALLFAALISLIFLLLLFTT